MKSYKISCIFFSKFIEILDILRDVIAQQKTPFVAWLGPKCFVAIDHPDDIQVVVNAKGCLEKSEIYRFFNRGVGLFTAPGEIISILLGFNFQGSLHYNLRTYQQQNETNLI